MSVHMYTHHLPVFEMARQFSSIIMHLHSPDYGTNGFTMELLKNLCQYILSMLTVIILEKFNFVTILIVSS